MLFKNNQQKNNPNIELLNLIQILHLHIKLQLFVNKHNKKEDENFVVYLQLNLMLNLY